jgi:Phytanoyl-CoA dioxygenase (PhyH)
MSASDLRSFAPVDPRGAALFAEHGWVVTDVLDNSGVALLREWVDEISQWPHGEGAWLHYHELTDRGPRLCRTENFVPFHAGMRALLTSGALVTTATMLLGEAAVLYKEKINYKLSGGAGYAAHQDAPAYPFVDAHVSCLVAVDDATDANGCLEVVNARHHQLLETDDRGCITSDASASMAWTPAPVRAGQALWFHSLTPHRSGPNRSDVDRRAVYPTYNAASAGDLRDDYYRTKLDRIAAQDTADRVVVSLIGDFEGRPVL